MSRLKAKASAANKRKKQQPSQDSFWQDLCPRIDAGQLIPIISDDVYYEQIFDIDGDGILGISAGEINENGWSIEEQLADAWADEIGFPLEGRHKLARVALYNRVVKSSDEHSAKTAYLNWLKQSLLFLAEDDPDIDHEMLAEQQDGLKQSSFADIAVELGYPRPIKGRPDALTRLAQLKLPIYITTSGYDFLERAILANGRTPHTQICFWGDKPMRYLDESHRPDYDFVPTPENPLVYHLFGLEDYPESMVLTEDDYLDFLAAISKDDYQKEPLLPLYLRQAITQSSLLLLGYQPRDWDFRILFRGLINATPSGLRMVNLAIQMNPDEQDWVTSADDIKRYLQGYFEEKEKQLNFSVKYDTTSTFVEKLWKEWDQWRR